MVKLFWENPYLKISTAKVLRIDKNDIYLDRTIIYSFSGGQQSDSGSIGGIGISDSRILDEKSIVYTLATVPTFSVGSEVELQIDWDKRYKIMRLHSATHVALAIFYDLVGKTPRCGANVSSEKGRLDFEYPEPITPLIPEIQRLIDVVIKEDHKIITKADENSDNPEGRVWLIPGKGDNWSMGCGGTHPRCTGELGLIKLKRNNIGRGKERLEITFL
jgi:Ser-tRNA(Ala) deacylase AlaX